MILRVSDTQNGNRPRPP